jgi:molybdenum cofactor cytidylyltransferase
MRLIEALRYQEGNSVAFVGAGGKTTALFSAARELLVASSDEIRNKTVLVTTTTHFGSWQAKLADHVMLLSSKKDLSKILQNYPPGIILLHGDEENDRLSAINAPLLDLLHAEAEKLQLPILIEADGSHTRPLKAPAQHEPVIPDFVQTVAVVAGLSGLGKKISLEWIHRPERFANLCGLNVSDEVTDEALIRVLSHQQGGLKNIPAAARRIILLNQADTVELQSQAKGIADRLMGEYHSAIISSLACGNGLATGASTIGAKKTGVIHAVIEPIAGIILAAGGSSRFGTPKQLLDWKGQPFIRHVITAAHQAGLSLIIVVLGDSNEEVIRAITNLPVRIAINPEWNLGVSTSIKTGVSLLPKFIGGAIFFQSDQPHVSPILVGSLVAAHQGSLNAIIAPLIDGQRGNPILFDCRTFHDLLNLVGDIGGRSLFSKYPVEWVTWHDPDQLLDVDTPEDYQRFMEKFPNNC